MMPVVGSSEPEFLGLLGTQGAHSPPNSLHRSSVARMMVRLAQRTLSMMTLRASPGPGCLESGATCHLSPVPWPTLLS